MSRFIGMYIEDENKNHEVIKRLLSTKSINIMPFETLPKTLELLYTKIITSSVDFIIIDFDLSKQKVNYSGVDALKYIREKDPEIYTIYLTNRPFIEEVLLSFDQAIQKKDFPRDVDIVTERLNRAISRDLSFKLEREIEDKMNQNKEFLETQIDLMKSILEGEEI